MNQPPANPMKLKFDMTVEDWIAFNVHHFRTSASGQSNSRRVAVVATLIPFSAAILFAAAGLNSLPLWLICGVLGLVLFFSVRRNYPAAIEKQTRRLLQEGSNKGLLGERELEIEPDGIVQRTELSASKHMWAAVEKVVETDDYVFIYLTAVSAHVLPKRSIPPDQLQAFLTRIRQNMSPY